MNGPTQKGETLVRKFNIVASQVTHERRDESEMNDRFRRVLDWPARPLSPSAPYTPSGGSSRSA